MGIVLGFIIGYRAVVWKFKHDSGFVFFSRNAESCHYFQAPPVGRRSAAMTASR
jgi:hypothetical protein